MARRVVRWVVAFVVPTAIFSALMGWAGYHWGLDGTGYGWPAFWSVFGMNFAVWTGMASLALICVALIDWASGD